MPDQTQEQDPDQFDSQTETDAEQLDAAADEAQEDQTEPGAEQPDAAGDEAQGDQTEPDPGKDAEGHPQCQVTAEKTELIRRLLLLIDSAHSIPPVPPAMFL